MEELLFLPGDDNMGTQGGEGARANATLLARSDVEQLAITWKS